MDSKIQDVINKQKEYFAQHGPIAIPERTALLKSFLKNLRLHEKDLTTALFEDLGRDPYESYLIEILPLFMETEHTCKRIRKWTKRKKVKTPLLLQPAKSWLEPQPYGQTLIVAPWNYPILLLLAPMLGAVAAGNTVLLVAAEETPKVFKVMQKIIQQSFKPEIVAMLPPGADSVNSAISQKMDYVFFTGSPRVGKIIMKQASEHLTPVTLELGGKSPCIVHHDANLEVASRRITWGRFANSGQTCVAPDYLMVHESIVESFKQKLIDRINEFYSSNETAGVQKLKIINSKNYQRLKSYLKKADILYGGSYDDATESIAPTLVINPAKSHPLSQEEIFGPILPIYTYRDTDELISNLSKQEKPLATYCFTTDSSLQKQLAQRTYSGGLLINDVVMHVASTELPFGGVGQSGMGAYHGKTSFETFTHFKPCLKKSYLFDFKFRYPPYPPKTTLLKILGYLFK